MWRTSLVVLLVAAIGCGAPAEAGNASLAGNAVPSTDYHLNTTNMLIVKFRGGRNYSEVVQLVHDTPGIALVKVMPMTGIAFVNVTDGASPAETAKRLAALPDVEFAEVEHLLHADGNVAQPDWTLQKLNVAPVWDQYTFGNCSTLICHIDSGVTRNSNSWYNPGEYGGIAGVDDDGNGVVDDFYGGNYLQIRKPTADSSDDSGHGTGTAGAAGGVNDGNSGSSLGVSPKVAIMPCVAMQPSGAISSFSVMSCIEYCKANFEDASLNGFAQRTGIYQMSFSGFGGAGFVYGGFIANMHQADSLGRTRALFVAAAGNGQTSAGNSLPASLGLSNLIAVTDSNQSDIITGNTGSWVDLAAPAGSSSSATGVGAGLAALMVSANPQLTPEQIKAAMVNGVNIVGGAQGKVASNGVLDAAKAFAYLQAQGLVQKASSKPDQSQQCDMKQAWAPAWSGSGLPCGPNSYNTSGCWQTYAVQY